VSRAEQEAVVERFLAAVRGGDLQGLLDVLAPDVVVVSDGGGVVAAAKRPIQGADRVGPLLLSSLARLAGAFEVMPMWLNGAPAARFELDGKLATVASMVIEDGRITRIYAILNPHKLARLDEEAKLSR
jgi:RNA polymerase sigma-70 factor (ECF subfamily)